MLFVAMLDREARVELQNGLSTGLCSQQSELRCQKARDEAGAPAKSKRVRVELGPRRSQGGRNRRFHRGEERGLGQTERLQSRI